MGDQKSYIKGQTMQWSREKDKYWSTKHYTENKRLSNMNITKNRGWTQVPRKGYQIYTTQVPRNGYH